MSNGQPRVQNTARIEPVFVISREDCQVVESWPLSDGDFPVWAQLRARWLRVQGTTKTKGQTWRLRRFTNSDFMVLHSTEIVRTLQAVGCAVVSSAEGFDQFMATALSGTSGSLRDSLRHCINIIPYQSGIAASHYQSFQQVGTLLDEIFVSWLYARRGPIANGLKVAKDAGNPSRQNLIADLCRIAWGKILPDIATWTKRHDGAPVILTPVPSRSDVSFLLCQELAKELRSSGVSASVHTDLLKRKSHSEMKDAPWERREKLAKEFYELDSLAQLSGTFLLVDDVMTSGATMRTCAALLHTAGASRVAAAALSAAPGDAPWAIASDAPHGFAFMAVNKKHQSCLHQMEGAF